MTGNDERLKGLQDGDKGPRKPIQNPVTELNNTANIASLQSSGNESIPRGAKPKQGNSNWLFSPKRSVAVQVPTKALVSAKTDWTKWLLRGGIGAAIAVGIMLTLLVATSILSTESTDADFEQSIEEVTVLDAESGGISTQGTPVDISALAASVTRSTVLIECTEGLGSGFVFDIEPLTGERSGEIIVTNQHVIEGCEGQNQLIVSTATSMSKGSVIAFDSAQDLAIIEAPALTAEPLSIGPVPVIGQWAMAVGSPDGITDTVTFGNITNVKLDQGFILSDVLIGPGNSGGPLVDNQGRVLGVNTAVLKVAEGFSFSVPIESLCDQLLECS